jgi:hypothetical protein
MFSDVEKYNSPDLLQRHISALLDVIKIEKRGKND